MAAGRAVQATPCWAVTAAAPAVRTALHRSVGALRLGVQSTPQYDVVIGLNDIPAIGTYELLGIRDPPKVMPPLGCSDHPAYLVHPRGHAGGSADCGRCRPESAESGARAAALAAAVLQLPLHLPSFLRNALNICADISMQHVLPGSCSVASKSWSTLVPDVTLHTVSPVGTDAERLVPPCAA